MPRKRPTDPSATFSAECRREIASRLTAVANTSGRSMNEIARTLLGSGVESTRQTVQSYMDGERDPSGAWLHVFAQAMGVRAAWLLTGEGPRDAGNEPSFLQAEKALVDAIAAASVSGAASEAALSAMSDYRDSIAINAEARCTARIQKVAANVAAVFAQEAA